MFKRRVLALAFVATACSILSAANVSAGFDVQNSLQIPGTVLQPGHYTLAVEEDVLKDRAIVRLTSKDGSLNFLLLTIPNRSMAGERHGPIVEWSTTGNRHVLRGWVRPGSAAPLEFAYPKDEAVALANDVDIRVLAIDPASQHLPALPSMTKDDMKIIDLWLLSYSRATADASAKKLSAEKYAPAQVASAPAPAHYAANTARPARLPHTASHTFELLIAGLILLSCSFFVRALRLAGKGAR